MFSTGIPLLQFLFLGVVLSQNITSINRFEPDLDDILANCETKNGTPLITPCNSSIILQYSMNITLKCEAGEPIRWYYGHNYKLNIPLQKTDYPEGHYTVSLKMNKVTTNYVGAYYCLKDSKYRKLLERSEEVLIKLVSQGLASSIYVYVNDTKNNAVVPYADLQGRQYTDFVIPCKPPMPDTEVVFGSLEPNTWEKSSNSWKISSKGRIEGNPGFFEKVSFHPRRGFTFRLNGSIAGSHRCNQRLIDIHYSAGQRYNYNIAGMTNHTIQMTATFKSYKPPECRWFKPDRTYVLDSETKFKIIHTPWNTTLQLDDAQPKDSGIYTLWVRNSYGTVERNYNVLQHSSFSTQSTNQQLVRIIQIYSE
ncbi:uncharacterized protein [Drosophila takahashii]|uniref:uncharacterized protein n=1 Tax=Drosophila takahashii TaxID=29030 RepID=UPI003898E3FD